MKRFLVCICILVFVAMEVYVDVNEPNITVVAKSMDTSSVVGDFQVEGKLKCIAGNQICSEWIDTETGVHYFYTPEGGLTPRYNSIGEVMITWGD